MNDEKTALVKEMIIEPAPVCVSEDCLGIEPYITVSAVIADDEEPVREDAKRLSRFLKKGKSRQGLSASLIRSS